MEKERLKKVIGLAIAIIVIAGVLFWYSPAITSYFQNSFFPHYTLALNATSGVQGQFVVLMKAHLEYGGRPVRNASIAFYYASDISYKNVPPRSQWALIKNVTTDASGNAECVFSGYAPAIFPSGYYLATYQGLVAEQHVTS